MYAARGALAGKCAKVVGGGLDERVRYVIHDLLYGVRPHHQRLNFTVSSPILSVVVNPERYSEYYGHLFVIDFIKREQIEFYLP